MSQYRRSYVSDRLPHVTNGKSEVYRRRESPTITKNVGYRVTTGTWAWGFAS